MVDGLMKLVQRHLAADAREWHRSKEADLKEVHSLQLDESSPEDPAAPVVCKTADLIMEASIDSNSKG